MKHTSLWFKPSKIVWWPSTFTDQNRGLMDIDWLKWKITLYFDGEVPEIPRLKDVLGWSLVAVLLFFTYALWCISEGLWH